MTYDRYHKIPLLLVIALEHGIGGQGEASVVRLWTDMAHIFSDSQDSDGSSPCSYQDPPLRREEGRKMYIKLYQ